MAKVNCVSSWTKACKDLERTERFHKLLKPRPTLVSELRFLRELRMLRTLRMLSELRFLRQLRCLNL